MGVMLVDVLASRHQSRQAEATSSGLLSMRTCPGVARGATRLSTTATTWSACARKADPNGQGDVTEAPSQPRLLFENGPTGEAVGRVLFRPYDRAGSAFRDPEPIHQATTARGGARGLEDPLG